MQCTCEGVRLGVGQPALNTVEKSAEGVRGREPRPKART
jgi:hypothetical protein